MIAGIEAYYKGLLLGLIFIVSFGPIFFALLETSINRGFAAAASMATGTMLSDVLYILVAFVGVSTLFENSRFKFWMGICGGILLIIFGIVYFLKKPKIEKVELNETYRIGYWGYALKGFAINALNPFVFVFWFSTMGIVSVEYENSRIDRLIFFAGVISCIYCSDLLKSYIANQISHLLNFRLMVWLNRIAGVVMLYFGAELLYKVFIDGKAF